METVWGLQGCEISTKSCQTWQEKHPAAGMGLDDKTGNSVDAASCLCHTLLMV